MKIEIYNGLLSDSNSFYMIDTKEVSLKAALYKLADWIERYFIYERQNEPDFNFENPSDEYMEEESNAGIWIINGHHIYASWDEMKSAALNASCEADNVEILDDSWGHGFTWIVKKN